MMIKRILVIVFILSYSVLQAEAQSTPVTKKIKFKTILHAGLLNGSKGSSLMLQGITGFSKNNTFAGLGVGLDYYRFRSIPLFIDLRHEFGKGNRHFLLYGDLGYHVDWLTEKNENEPFFNSLSNYNGGIYYDAGIGYQVRFKSANAFLLSAGYSYKKMENKLIRNICPIGRACFEEKQTYAYAMPRLVIKMGWLF